MPGGHRYSCGLNHQTGTRPAAMRAEIESIAENAKQSIGLLRRHL